MFGFGSLFGIVVAISCLMALFVPFFIMQIRDSAKRIDKKLDKLDKIAQSLILLNQNISKLQRHNIVPKRPVQKIAAGTVVEQPDREKKASPPRRLKQTSG